MAIAPGLHLNQKQQLKLTPQLQQSIKLLQSSTLEVEQIILQTLEDNYVLELDDEANDDHDEAELDDQHDNTDPSETELNVDDTKLKEDLDIDASWEDVFMDEGFSSSQAVDEDYTSPESYTAHAENLSEYLEWQLNLVELTDTQQLIGLAIIDSLNNDGFFTQDLTLFAQTFTAQGLRITPRQIEQVLSVVQEFEPAGVAAQNIQQSLAIQLSTHPHPLAKLAQRMIHEHFDWITNRDMRRLRHVYQLANEQLDAIYALIQTLNPRPSQAFTNTEQNIIRPDLILRRDENSHWLLELNPDAFPKVRLNNMYASLGKTLGEDQGARQVKEYVQEAKNLLKSLKNRGETLFRVGMYILEQQKAFFEQGETAMQPLILKDVADELNLHESTISRASSNKYIQTPRGTYELKYFFSSSISQFGMEDQSSIAIKAHIKALLDAEDPKKPLSDNKLMEMLEEEHNISIARRTIAKYREAMNIGSSSERRQRY